MIIQFERVKIIPKVIFLRACFFAALGAHQKTRPSQLGKKIPVSFYQSTLFDQFPQRER